MKSRVSESTKSNRVILVHLLKGFSEKRYDITIYNNLRGQLKPFAGSSNLVHLVFRYFFAIYGYQHV